MHVEYENLESRLTCDQHSTYLNCLLNCYSLFICHYDMYTGIYQ